MKLVNYMQEGCILENGLNMISWADFSGRKDYVLKFKIFNHHFVIVLYRAAYTWRSLFRAWVYKNAFRHWTDADVERSERLVRGE